MRNICLISLFVGMWFFADATNCFSMTLEGNVEESVILEMPRVIARSHAEGHIGVRISKWGNISFVHPGSPAEQAGLQKNDIVLTVDGRRRAIDDISGDPGTMVNLEIKRGHDKFVVDVPRIDCRQIL